MQEIIDFIKGFNKDKVLPFCCPFCNQHSLSLKKDTWREYDNSQYHLVDEHVEAEDCVSYIYTAFYFCRNNSCNQEIISSGTGRLSLDECYYEGEYCRAYYSIYQPKIFLPPLHFFKIPENTPFKIKSLLELSFSIVLQSPASAVNSLRSCIEELLDIHSLPKNRSLHHRIEQDVPKDSVLAPYGELMMAIKWLGNTGSHGDDIDIASIIDVYEIMNIILIGLYTDNKIILERARLINKLKRPLSSQERRKI